MEQASERELDGIATLRYREMIDWGRLDWGTKDKRGDPGSPPYVEMWIDKEDHTIRLAEVQIYVLVDDPEYGQAEQFVISGLVKYFDLNEPVKIRPPITPSGDLEEGWSLISPVAPKKKTGPVAVEK
tara:strand:- start:153 stop:533 length:381 start_codon:yes stop_codon:yes gene_type:complete